MIWPIQELEHLVAPWQTVYLNSKVLSIGIAGAHVVSLLFGGGYAIAADRLTLRAWRNGVNERRRQLAELSAVHRPVLIALTCSFVTGALLAATDIKAFASSRAFWIKLILVALLLVNGGLLNLIEKRLRARSAVRDGAALSELLWRRLRTVAVWSIALWTATLISGVALQNVS
jgi:hypothetical protein